MARESAFQAGLIRELKERFEGCIVLKNDATYIQGIPDLLVLYRNKWAALECKISMYAHHQPNQQYYIDKMRKMSYAAMIYPENKPYILSELDEFFMS